MALFSGTIYISSASPEQAANWYREKFDGKRVRSDRDDVQDIFVVPFSSEGDEYGVISIGKIKNENDPVPVLYTSNVEKARKILSQRGVSVKPLQSDRQGNQFFEFCDFDSNVVE